MRLAALGAALWIGLLPACVRSQDLGGAVPAGPPRVILVVGDGAALAQWSALRLAGEEPLAVEQLPVIGLVDTRCACPRVTDSGAAATAFSTGHRTQYRFIGMGPDSAVLETVLEAAQRRGLATGLVTTTQITDATPAAFAAHVVSRYDRFRIAEQLAARGVDVLLGGGYANFARRPDGRDLVEELRATYTVVRTPAELSALDLDATSRLLGLFADSTTWGQAHLRPTLPEMASAALAIVDRDPDGFFLLLESEDTDDAFHDNLPLADALASMRELDRTVAIALEYQARRPGTLIVVIGDHETGGLAVRVTPDGQVEGAYTTTDHTSILVPVFAGGPGAERFGRWLTNAEVGRLLFEAVGAEWAER